jgi:acyl-CoA dehydrogenase
VNEEQQLILETTNRILNDLCTAEVINNSEAGSFAGELWQTLSETGLTLAGFPESLGGSGGQIQDSLMVIREAAKFGAPLPLAETFIAAHLLQSVGEQAGDTPLTVAAGTFEIDSNSMLTGQANNVAFARWCKDVVFIARKNSRPVLCRAATDQFEVSLGSNMAGEPRDGIRANFKILENQVFETSADLSNELQLLGAMTRSVMMAGALESALELSVEYALQRNQFGRPIAKFQAVQQQLAIFAGEVAASIRAADALVESAGALNEMEVAVAKSRIGDAVGISADIAHQVHGAMGYTMEHNLNHRTRRLWCWRDEYGNERYWQQVLGKQITAVSADELWPMIVAST